MSKRIRGKESSGRIASDGTAARTRPLSIEEIMLRREKKAASEANKDKEGAQNNDKGNFDHLDSEKRYRSQKDLKDMPVEGSRKDNLRDMPKENSKKDNLKDAPKEGSKKDVPKDGSKKDAPKEGSKKDNLKDAPKKGSRKDDPKDTRNEGFKKEEKRFIRDDNHFGKDRGMLSSQKLSSSKSSRNNERKDGNHNEFRARNGDIIRYEFQKEPGKRWHNEPADDDRIKERHEKLKIDTKRKSRGFDNDRSSELDRPTLKKYDSARFQGHKYDSARFQDHKHYDRIDRRKEYAKPYHEEPRSKRRRSSSRDHERGKLDRSVSLSPREQRHSYRGHDYENSPPYESMEKSRRKYSETDRYRPSGNGGYSGGSYRKRGSPLGGYSPRKRKVEPKAEQPTNQAPSPVRSPEKKTATWDQPPSGANQPSFFASFQSTVNQMTSSVPVTFTVLKQDPAATLESMLAGKEAAVDSVQLTQATRPLRRLYVENLPSVATEKTLIDCLNDFLLSSGVNHIQGTKPCLSCSINKEKCQAFVEFLTPEDATAALSFNGRSFYGSVLKIRRPKDYVEIANVVPKKPVEDIKIVSGVVRDSPHKIFLAGISGAISSEMLMEIVSAFGSLAAYCFLFNEELGRPCAFFEYVDHSITSKACAGLNGMKLGGCILTAIHGFVNPPEPEAASIEDSPFYDIPGNAKPLLAEPTMVLRLNNMLDREEFLLLSKSELEELLEDIRMECTRFGAVKSINAVKYPSSCDKTMEGTIVEPKDGSLQIKAVAGGPIPNQSEEVPDPHDPIEPQDVEPIPDDHDKKELDELLPSNGDCERDVPSVDQCADLDDIHTADVFPTMDQGVVSEAAKSENKHMEVDNHACAVDHGNVDKGHADPVTTENLSPTVPRDEAEKSRREDEQQDAATEVSAEKVHKADARDDSLVSDTDLFEPGSVLVEFVRKEATCLAAHSLHGRLFGNRTVSAGYVPHDLYLLRYPR